MTQVLVQKYPSVAFHQKTQLFAVGTGASNQSQIMIYDLRTATKWRILEGGIFIYIYIYIYDSFCFYFNNINVSICPYVHTFIIVSGHTGTVAAVSFSPNGDDIVSYSPDEDPPSLRSWNISGSGLILL